MQGSLQFKQPVLTQAVAPTPWHHTENHLPFSPPNQTFPRNLHVVWVSSCAALKHLLLLTWQNWPQSKRASGGGDASDDAVEQKADLLALSRRKQKNTGPCRKQVLLVSP